MKIASLFLIVCLLASFGCSSDRIVGLDSEVLTVSVTTAGTNLDPDGYLLTITGERDTPIGVNESLSFTVLTIEITVELLDIAANCTAMDNPQTVDVESPTTVAFFVECV